MSLMHEIPTGGENARSPLASSFRRGFSSPSRVIEQPTTAGTPTRIGYRPQHQEAMPLPARSYIQLASPASVPAAMSGPRITRARQARAQDRDEPRT